MYHVATKTYHSISAQIRITIRVQDCQDRRIGEGCLDGGLRSPSASCLPFETSDTLTYSMVEGDCVDGHEVTEVILVRNVVATPRHHVEWRVILHRRRQPNKNVSHSHQCYCSYYFRFLFNRPVSLEIIPGYAMSPFTFSALTLLVGRQEGHPACKKTGCQFGGGNWSFARLIAPIVTTASIILCFTPANPGSPGKWPLKQGEREREVMSPWVIQRRTFSIASKCEFFLQTRRPFGHTKIRDPPSYFWVMPSNMTNFL